MHTNKRILTVALLAGTCALGACSDLFKVTNPGPIPDEQLNTPDAMRSLASGMSADLSIVLDDVMRMTSIAADELYHGGSYTFEGLWNRGILRPDEVNYEWAAMHRARAEAEQGILRMKTVLGDSAYNVNVYAARANLWAGFANRLLGENVCQAVFDGGAAQSHTVHFQRAEAYFTEALRLATNINNTGIRYAALGGRASVLADQGKWAEAVADAQLVPTSYVWNAVYSKNSARENNSLAYETYAAGTGRREFTVFNTQWAKVFGDPRVPWDTVRTSTGAVQKGQDGKTNFFRQLKYLDLDADVPLVKGTEMLMLRAEDALRNNNIPGAFVLINQQRAFYSTAAKPLPALTPPTDITQAWQIFEKERGAVMWIEARRFWDIRRWLAAGGPDSLAFATDTLNNNHKDFAAGLRDTCIPISQEEVDANSNIP